MPTPTRCDRNGNMSRVFGYRILCGVVGLLFLLGGVALVLSFFQWHAPGAVGNQAMPVGPNGAYFMAFSGCALVAWGGSLIGGARRPLEGTWIGTWTAVALVLMALYRIAAWIVGDYAALGDVLRVEAFVFLCFALGFVWLRPARSPAAG